MSQNKNICPIMTKSICNDKGEIQNPILCQQSKCQLWISVSTTEFIQTEGCCFELQPQMSNGLLRV